MVRFLHLADLHLGAQPGYLEGRAEERRDDFLQAFKRAVDFTVAPENQIDFVVIAGDFFDSSHPSAELVNFAVQQLKRLQREDIPAVAVPGNHDSLSIPGSVYGDPSSPLRQTLLTATAPNPQPFAALNVRGLRVHFYGMAWNPGQSTPPYDAFQAEDDGGIHIAVLHATLEGAQYGELHSRDVPLRLENLAESGMDYIALGHIHAPQEHLAGEVPVVYPGTLEGKRFKAGECGRRELLVVEIDEDHAVHLERIPWNRRTLLIETLNLNTSPVETLQELAEEIRSRYGSENHILRLKLEGTIPFLIDEEALASRLAGEFFHLELRDDTDVFDSAVIAEWQGENTIRGLFIRKLQQRMEAAESAEEREQIELALKLGVQSFQDRGG